MESQASEFAAGSGLLFKGPIHILVVRPDRLGDVILSTPVFDLIKTHYSKSHLTVMIKEPVLPVLQEHPSVDQFMLFEPEGKHRGLKGFLRLYREIKSKNFLVSIILQSHWKIAAALFFARVRYRIGPLSKFHSFLFYNRGIRQRRSHVEMHEADYNLQLLRRLGIRTGTRNVPTRVQISQSVQEQAKEWLKSQSWDFDRPSVVIHPGMGGSAINWPESHYIELIRCLLEDKRQVLISGGPTEGELLGRIERALGPLKNSVLFYTANKDRKVDFLGALYYFAHVVVAPSTGPLHLAVALGRPVVTFFPPVRVQSAIRWGPYLQDETRASILVPEVYCGQDFNCLGSHCNYFPCMKGLTVRQALEEVNRQFLHSFPVSNQSTSNPGEYSSHGEKTK